MKYYVYSVLDAKMGVFSGLILDMTDDSAIRGFADGVNDSNASNKLFKHPEDFALYRLGEYHQDTGIITPEVMIKCLVTASAVKSVNSQLDLPLAVN